VYYSAFMTEFALSKLLRVSVRRLRSSQSGLESKVRRQLRRSWPNTGVMLRADALTRIRVRWWLHLACFSHLVLLLSSLLVFVGCAVFTDSGLGRSKVVALCTVALSLLSSSEYLCLSIRVGLSSQDRPVGLVVASDVH
jgi:hypothetical protein